MTAPHSSSTSLMRNRIAPLVILLSLFLSPLSAQNGWVEIRSNQTREFPTGYKVVADPRADAKVIKSVPGPTVANVKWLYRNPAGVVFYLSDWSAERRFRGESHYWILPNPEGKRPAPQPVDTVYNPARELSFPNGFHVLKSPSAKGQIVSKVNGPATAKVKAKRRVGNVDYYISDWSWEQLQRGKDGNWMRAIAGAPAPPAPPKKPDLPKGLHWSERPHDRVFGEGYDVLSEPKRDIKPLSTTREPSKIRVAAEASGRDGIFYLTPAANAKRLRGESFTWLRERKPRVRADLVPRMRALQGGHKLYFETERYADRPWQFSADLFSHSPDASLAALREFGVFANVADMAPYYEDREYPLLWLKEVARYLNEKNQLDDAAEIIRKNLPMRQKALQLWQNSEEAEMMPGIVRQHIQFDTRLLAIFEEERGNYAAVEKILSPLLSDWDPEADGLNSSGPRINMLRSIARAQWKQGAVEAAKKSTRTWLRIYSGDIAREIIYPNYYSASERVMEFDNDFEAVGGYYDLLEAVTDPEVAAEIVVGLKGLRLAVESSAQARRSTGSNAESNALVRELLALESAEQKANLAGDEPDYARLDRISKLNGQLATLRLGGAGVDLADEPEWIRLAADISKRLSNGVAKWQLDELIRMRDTIALNHLVENGGFFVTPDQIRDRLADGEALVDFYRTPPATFGEAGKYAAVILRPGKETQLVALGSDEKIDAVVKRYRDFILGLGEFQEDDLEGLNQKADEIIRSTFRELVGPLLPHLDGANDIIFCPEGQLSFLPFDFLGESATKLLLHDHEVTYVNAARDLTRQKVDAGNKRTALLLGDPNFEERVGGSTTAPAENAEADREMRSLLADASRGIEFAPLPGTAEEIQKLGPLLEESGYEVKSLSEASATEENLVNAIQSPTILHLATHGFFLQSLPVAKLATEPRSAMQLSGLALTGGQVTLESWNGGQIPDPGNDGILFASEVSRLDLTGTETVVLSACETAVGKALSGEGVEGLRSGLTLAGAQNVLLTLWPVDDIVTINVMQEFYRRHLDGTPSPAALNEARRKLFGELTEEMDVFRAHRFIGPFLLTRTAR